MRRSAIAIACICAVLVLPVSTAVTIWTQTSQDDSVRADQEVSNLVPLHGPNLPFSVQNEIPEDLSVLRVSGDAPSSVSLYSFPSFQSWSPPASKWTSGFNTVSHSQVLDVDPGQSLYLSTDSPSDVVPLGSAATTFPWIRVTERQLGPHSIKLTLRVTIQVSDNLIDLGPLSQHPWSTVAQSCRSSSGAESVRWIKQGGPSNGTGYVELANSSGSLACSYSSVQHAGSELRVQFFARGTTTAFGCLYSNLAASCQPGLTGTASGGWHLFSTTSPAPTGSASLYLYGPVSGTGIADYSSASVNSITLPANPIIIVASHCSLTSGSAPPSLGRFLSRATDCDNP